MCKFSKSHRNENEKENGSIRPAKVVIRNIFKPGSTLQEQRSAFESMKSLVIDLLCDLPASSVEVAVVANNRVQYDIIYIIYSINQYIYCYLFFLYDIYILVGHWFENELTVDHIWHGVFGWIKIG